ncbi:hypothetical protein BELL_0050g00070 [Botrytis elliptica]|uniref:Uncharacterized protein n=1 Tax=Botrytis elliptica TaxID=278938 RepID=A0A4Z1JZX9_9HELO|nr:hypothetical protein BELL_0050g00070 [Botrytis elliptica]
MEACLARQTWKFHPSTVPMHWNVPPKGYKAKVPCRSKENPVTPKNRHAAAAMLALPALNAWLIPAPKPRGQNSNISSF